MEPTTSLHADSPSFSQPHPPSYRHTLALPPRTSSLMATIGYRNMDSYAQNALAIEFPESSEASVELQNEKSRHWARLKRKMGRSLITRSNSSVHSLKQFSPTSETNSAKYSVREADTPSTATEDAPSTPSDISEYTKQLNEAAIGLNNDFVSGAREMADSALATLSSLIVAAGSAAQSRNELSQMAISAAEELSNARPSMNAAITSCLLRALDEVMKLWDMLDEKRSKAPDDLAAMARRQLVRILEKRKESGMRLSDNFAERLRAYCRQVCFVDPPSSPQPLLTMSTAPQQHPHPHYSHTQQQQHHPRQHSHHPLDSPLPTPQPPHPRIPPTLRRRKHGFSNPIFHLRRSQSPLASPHLTRLRRSHSRERSPTPSSRRRPHLSVRRREQ
jgi:hypothetical protein